MKYIKYYIIFQVHLLLFACNSPEVASSEKSSENLQTPNVRVEKVFLQYFEGSQEITGTVEAGQSVVVNAMEGGFVKMINKDIGDYIPAGYIIARLENPEITQQVKLAEAKIKSVKADYESALSSVKIARAEKDYKNSSYERIKDIYTNSKGLVTIDELEKSKAEAEISSANFEKAQSLPTYFKAMLESAEASKEAALIRKNSLNVKAPFSGYVTKRYVDRGAFIQSAITSSKAAPIVDMIDDAFTIVVEYPESLLASIFKGSEVKISVPSLNGLEKDAAITRMSKALNPLTKTVRAEIDVEEMDGIKAGMYVKVISKLKSSAQLISIPKIALTAEKNKTFIYKILEGIVHKVPVSLGLEDRDRISILTGDITENDLVVVSGKNLLTEGQRVNYTLN